MRDQKGQFMLMGSTKAALVEVDGRTPYQTLNSFKKRTMYVLIFTVVASCLTPAKSDIDDQNGRSFVFTPAELWLLQRGGDDVEEIDELQDDSSLLNESNDEDSTRNGKKRRRRPSPPDRKPTRVSARKRQRREEPEVTKVNGDIPRKSNGHTAGLEPTLARLKGSKGQNTKFWYYEEGDSAPSKRPEMLDDPEKMIKRSRKSEKTPDADTLLREAKNPLENEPGKNGDLTMEPVP